jgi:hypothetical protein
MEQGGILPPLHACLTHLTLLWNAAWPHGHSVWVGVLLAIAGDLLDHRA